MLSEPKIVTRSEQPYAAIRLSLDGAQIPQLAPPLVGEIMEWVAKHGKQAGPAFFNYTRMDGSRMDLEVGAPTAGWLAGDGRVVTGTLPAGRYATVTFTGPYDQLRGAHEELHKWLAAQGMQPFDMGAGGLTLLEIYHTDPVEEPDPQKWVTEIAFRLSE